MLHSRSRPLAIMSVPFRAPVQPYTSEYLIPRAGASRGYNLLSVEKKFGQEAAGSREGGGQAAVPFPFLIWPRS